jgi:beta-xylosidase
MYCPNLRHSHTFTGELESLIKNMDNNNPKKHEFTKFYDPTQNNRSFYLDADGSWKNSRLQEHSEAVVDSYLDIVIFAYNCLLGHVEAEHHEWIESTESTDLVDILQQRTKNNPNLGANYIQKYDTLLENSNINTEILNWSNTYRFINDEIIPRIEKREINSQEDIFDAVYTNHFMNFNNIGSKTIVSYVVLKHHLIKS